MKVTNWRRKLAATLAAGGILVPAALPAANLNENLLTNAGFENVNINASEGGYNAVEILDWTDGTATGYAYSHDGSLNGAGGTIPDYANGGIYTGGTAPAGGGSFYFTSNATPGDVTAPGQFSQNIDLTGGDSGSLIAAGEAAITISAIFSSFATQGDFGTVHVEFLDGANASLGSVAVSDSDTTTWTANSTAGLIPQGTTTAQVSLFGTALGGGPDGYIDNVDVQVASAADFLLYLEVNTVTGETLLRNDTGQALAIDYYEVFSNAGSLDATTWNSFQNQDLAGFPAGNGSGNGWEEAGGSDEGVLSESYLTGNSLVADQAAISLGALYDPGDPQDLSFSYSVVADSGASLVADFDGSGDTGGNDFLVWQRGVPVTHDADSLADWEGEFGASGGPIGPGTLVRGFVRYVTPTAAAVPEPTTLILVGMGLASCTVGRRFVER